MGPTTGVTFTCNDKFGVENRKVFAAVNASIEEAFLWINADKRRSGQALHGDDEGERTDQGRADAEPTPEPGRQAGLFPLPDGTVKAKPLSWRDLFFPEAHELAGSCTW
jgi:NitT/TauT family transport system substrate-binding protein